MIDILPLSHRGVKPETPPAPTRATVLDEAKEIVTQDREAQYGGPEKNFELIAALWADYLQGRGVKLDFLEAYDVAAMMALVKIARIATGSGKLDNWIDLAGYAACGGELQEETPGGAKV